MAFKIVHIRDECIGCGACASICSNFWEMESDGKVKLKGAKSEDKKFILEIDNLKCNKDAAESCPVNCIHIYNREGEKVV